MAAVDHDESIWRPSWSMRVLVLAGLALTVGFGLSIIDIAADEGAAWEAAAFVAVCFGLPQILLLRFAFRSRVEVRRKHLRVVTMFGDHELEWTQIHGAEPGYNGMTVLLADGQQVLAGAVQKNNIATWLNRRTRADDLADLVRERAATASP